jgi:hypothetical protein
MLSYKPAEKEFLILRADLKLTCILLLLIFCPLNFLSLPMILYTMLFTGKRNEYEKTYSEQIVHYAIVLNFDALSN